MLRIKLEKSLVGHNWRRRRTASALGLRKIRQVVEHNDTPSIRGMIHAIHDLVTVETVAATEEKPKKATKSAPAAEVEEAPAPKPKKTAKKSEDKENS